MYQSGLEILGNKLCNVVSNLYCTFAKRLQKEKLHSGVPSSNQAACCSCMEKLLPALTKLRIPCNGPCCLRKAISGSTIVNIRCPLSDDYVLEVALGA